MIKMWSLPNYITGVRMIGGLSLWLIEPFSTAFYVVYSLCGISDVLDGWVARKMKMTSEFGAKLDSIADLEFYVVILVKIAPFLQTKLPMAIWYATAAVLVLRLISYAVGAVKYRRFAALHTNMNKLTGILVFAVPYLIYLPVAVPFCAVACTIAGLASVEELWIHIRRKEYHADLKAMIGTAEHRMRR